MTEGTIPRPTAAPRPRQRGLLGAMLRSLLSRKLRLLLSTLAVVLGTMFMAGACTAGDTVTEGFRQLFTSVNENIDVEVTATYNGPDQQGGNVVTVTVPGSMVSTVAGVDGVQSATGYVASDGARVIGRDGKVVGSSGAPQLGTNWVPAGGLVELRTGRGPEKAGEIAMNGALAEAAGVTVGDRVDVITLAPRRTFTLVGIFGYRGGRDSLGGVSEVAFITPEAQQLMLGRTGVFTSVGAKARDGVSPEALRDRIAAAVGPGYTVRTGEQAAEDQSKDVAGFLNILRNGLVGFAIVALFVGAFLIFNTFSILVAQRTRELALMRAVGASRRQVTWGVLGEAALTGLVASAIGLLLGIGVGWLLAKVLQGAFGQLPVRGVVVRPGVVLGTLLAGTLITVAATVPPALRASRVPPVAAMREAVTPDKPLRRLTLTGVVTLAVGVLLLGLKLFGDVKTGGSLTTLLLAGGAALCFLGVAMISPLLARPVTSGIGWLFGRAMPGRLGRRNTGRNPRRTAVTAGALMIGVALVTGASVFASSAKAGVRTLVERDLRADLVVAPSGFNAPTAGFPPSEVTRMRQLPGVASAVAVQSDAVRVDGHDTFGAAVYDVASALPMFHIEPVAGELRAPGADEIILDEGTATAIGRGVGDQVTLSTARAPQPRPVRVIGVFAASQLASGPVVSDAAAATFTSPKAQAGYVKVAEGADVATVKGELERLFADSPDLTVSDQSEVIRSFTQPLDYILVIITALLGFAIVIAVLGVVNTLLLSILERTRELGLLRAVGMSRRQIGGMVTVESVLISLFGALLGIAVGVALGVALVEAAGGDFLRLTMPWGYLVGALVLAVLAGVVAAIIPAIRAGRLNVLAAIAYE